MGSRVSSPTHDGKSELFEPSRHHYNIVNRHEGQVLITLCKEYSRGLVVDGWSSFLLDPTLNTSPLPHLQKVLPCRHSCHARDLGLGIPREVM
jgi:hypothetical protein